MFHEILSIRFDKTTIYRNLHVFLGFWCWQKAIRYEKNMFSGNTGMGVLQECACKPWFLGLSTQCMDKCFKLNGSTMFFFCVLSELNVLIWTNGLWDESVWLRADPTTLASHPNFGLHMTHGTHARENTKTNRHGWIRAVWATGQRKGYNYLCFLCFLYMLYMYDFKCLVGERNNNDKTDKDSLPAPWMLLVWPYPHKNTYDAYDCFSGFEKPGAKILHESHNFSHKKSICPR